MAGLRITAHKTSNGYGGDDLYDRTAGHADDYDGTYDEGSKERGIPCALSTSASPIGLK